MHWVDIIHYPALVEHLKTQDAMLDELGEYCHASRDPDGEGVLDAIEDAIGHGFFYVQRYMIQRKRATNNAYICGPRVGRYFFAQVINAAANYWKHVDEWPETMRPASQAHHTDTILREAGAPQADYRLSKLLYVLEPDTSLSALLPRVVAWRDAFDAQRTANNAPISDVTY